MFNHFVKLYF